jgi:PKD repeat protein
MTFLPGTAGSKIIVEFSAFNVEWESNCDYDWLKIYDGSTTGASLIGTYCGTDSPGTVEATNDDGALTFEFHSDYSVNESGWKALVSCSAPPMLPVADFTADPTHIIMGQSVQFSDLSSNNPTSWSWTFQGGTPATSSEQNPLVTYQEAGTYDVTLTVENQYGSDTKTVEGYITVDSTIGIDELADKGLTIFPNPLSGDMLTIESETEIHRVALYDLSGVLLLQKNFDATHAVLNLQKFESGLYFLQVTDGSGIRMEKISIVK